jgi:hypothetical protein
MRLIYIFLTYCFNYKNKNKKTIVDLKICVSSFNKLFILFRKCYVRLDSKFSFEQSKTKQKKEEKKTKLRRYLI